VNIRSIISSGRVTNVRQRFAPLLVKRLANQRGLVYTNTIMQDSHWRHAGSARIPATKSQLLVARRAFLAFKREIPHHRHNRYVAIIEPR
jgi:hypothetical protein